MLNGLVEQMWVTVCTIVANDRLTQYLSRLIQQYEGWGGEYMVAIDKEMGSYRGTIEINHLSSSIDRKFPQVHTPLQRTLFEQGGENFPIQRLAITAVF